MTVERADPGEPADLADALPTGRSTHLRARVQDLLGEHQSSGGALRIRRGAIVDELLAEVTDTDSDVLAIGYHRGGPPGVIDAGSTARRLAHTAPCAVLTIPL
jgi:nucleotide-binding universal stress UspA family protein